jgi:hypothetical protein
MSQEKIQTWIERIPCHLEQIRDLKGGNKYREGQKDKDSREWKKKRIKGKLSVREDLGPEQLALRDG